MQSVSCADDPRSARWFRGALVSSAKAAEFCTRFPSVEFVDVSGAGYMVAGDRNDAFTAAVVDFLRRNAPVAAKGTELQ